MGDKNARGSNICNGWRVLADEDRVIEVLKKLNQRQAYYDQEMTILTCWTKYIDDSGSVKKSKGLEHGDGPALCTISQQIQLKLIIILDG